MENNNSTKLPNQNALRYLPSKKIRIVIGIIIIIAILFALRNPIISLKNKIFHKTPTQTEITDPLLEQSQAPLSIDEDTDGDGLLDWQEVLLGTDTRIPNSKTDVPDSIREIVNISKESVTAEDKLALKIYQRLLTEPQGTNINEALQAATSKEMLDYADSLDNQLTNYTLDDLELIDNTAELESVYKSAITATLKNLTPKPETLEQVYASLLSPESTNQYSGLDKKLSQGLSALLKMPVPLRFADIHLSLVNSITHMSRALEKASIPTDASTKYALFLVFQKNWNMSVQTATALAAMFQL